ncbi:hypothetical protein [Spiroplasma endosymbiont of Amphimallon solstitiale]|uniref:hypothetical protein n=1 Tax=Spiroplasma endosymbiont of Amphimallon solstitiale TaxID=3066288 RepID=UPI00313D3F7E
MKFYKVIKIYLLNNIFHEFELLNVDSMTYKEQIQNKNILNIGTIYYNNRNKTFSGGGNSYPERGKINLIGDIDEIYQYQGIDTPTEFIADKGTERDYYTKQETNNLLDKKQNISDNNLQTINKTVVGAINENKSNIDKKQDKENWKVIGNSLDNRTWEDFTLGFNKYYRVIITWEKPPFNQVNTRITVEFKTGSYLGGSVNEKFFLEPV